CAGNNKGNNKEQITNNEREPSLLFFVIRHSLFLLRLDLLFDRRAIDRVAVTGEGALPCADRLGGASELRQDVAMMILDDRVADQNGRGLAKRLGRFLDLALLEERPSERIEICGIARLDLERALGKIDGAGEPQIVFGKDDAEGF